MEDAGTLESTSICEVLARRVDRVMVLRVLCVTWLVPAASLIWIGLTSAGLRRADPGWVALALGRTQALVVLLTVFTVLIGASAFVRRSAAMATSLGPWRWSASHLLAGLASALAATVAAVVEPSTSLLVPLAACAGFWAGLALPRALIRLPGTWAGPMAALAVGVAFQLSVGWLHVIHPATASPALVVEGAILAWAAASAGRVDPLDVASPEAVVIGTQLSSGPVQPSFPEPAAGR